MVKDSKFYDLREDPVPTVYVSFTQANGPEQNSTLMALGANRSNILRMVLQDAAILLGIGLVVGTGLTIAAAGSSNRSNRRGWAGSKLLAGATRREHTPHGSSGVSIVWKYPGLTRFRVPGCSQPRSFPRSCMRCSLMWRRDLCGARLTTRVATRPSARPSAT
jgi:hypothetical protein